MDLLDEIVKGLAGNDRIVLATIVGAYGSTPVPSGATMIVSEGGDRVAGTVGGGCLEADILAEAKTLCSRGGPSSLRSVTLSEDDLESGMLCGGRVEILIETLDAGQRDLYTALRDRWNDGHDSLLIRVMGAQGEVRNRILRPVPGTTETERAEWNTPWEIATPPGRSMEDLAAAAVRAHRSETVCRFPADQGEVIIEPVIGRQDLIIFGGGHVSRFVSRSAAMAGFRVTVVDDRMEYANPTRFPEAARTLAMHFEESWAHLEIRPATSIVIVTRGHKFDELVLEHAVGTAARYIGMIGSARKVTLTFGNLLSRGISAERLRAVHAPVGLAIGAVTAEEIGISITAELIAARRGVGGAVPPMSDRIGGAIFRRPGKP